MTLHHLSSQAAQFWDRHQTGIVLVGGVIGLLLLARIGWKFYKTQQRSKTVSTLAAVVVMAWTSEGLLHVALTKFHMPAGFASVTFFVFEAMLVACWLKAEEHRAAKGVPGPAGQYAFVIGAAQGVVASFGAHDVGEVVLRLLLPALSIGLAWIFLVAERDTDTDEMKAERARRVADREATWVHTPRTVAVKVGLMKPGNVTTTDAQREHQIARMVVAADTIASGGRGVERARRTLRRLARTADDAMVDEVAARARRTANAEALMVPASLPPGHDQQTEPSAELAEDPPSLDVEDDDAATDHETDGAADETTANDPPQPPPADPPKRTVRTRRQPAKRAARKTSTTTVDTPALVAHWHAKMPTATHADLAAAAGVSVRSVERYRPKADRQPINGTEPELTSPIQ